MEKVRRFLDTTQTAGIVYPTDEADGFYASCGWEQIGSWYKDGYLYNPTGLDTAELKAELMSANTRYPLVLLK